MTKIAGRPEQVLDRSGPGRWEGALLVARSGRSHLVTLAEGHSRYLRVLALPDARSSRVIAALARPFKQLPEGMAPTLVEDRGIEMTRHQVFSAAIGVPLYFCGAYWPRQRGSNENPHGLLRQSFLTKTDQSVITSETLAACVAEVDQRPRAALARQSPLEVYDRAAVALTAEAHRRRGSTFGRRRQSYTHTRSGSRPGPSRTTS